MHVPLGWASLLVGVLGAVVHVVKRVRGEDADFATLVASIAAFVAGWVACVSIPRLERRIGGARLGPHGKPEAPAPESRA